MIKTETEILTRNTRDPLYLTSGTYQKVLNYKIMKYFSLKS